MVFFSQRQLFHMCPLATSKLCFKKIKKKFVLKSKILLWSCFICVLLQLPSKLYYFGFKKSNKLVFLFDILSDFSGGMIVLFPEAAILFVSSCNQQVTYSGFKKSNKFVLFFDILSDFLGGMIVLPPSCFICVLLQLVQLLPQKLIFCSKAANMTFSIRTGCFSPNISTICSLLLLFSVK